ncbi:MAG: FAD-dependent oxidoreductase [Thermoplasmata archaeon]|nr:MAG: FAD-dependent oxidoreductase [Thermoplasmata archaeon]
MSSDVKWDYSQYPGHEEYPELFKSIKIGSLSVPNRIKYAATEDNLNSHEGYVTDADVAYIKERAKGVVGGICTIQGVYMDPKGEGRGYVGQAAAWDDKFIPGLKRLADAIHEEGAVSNYQLMHCGRVGGVELDYCVGPSAIPQRLRVFQPVKEMSAEDIKRCVQEHADATRRGLEAGYQIMEISGIVGYLVSNFLSKYTNRRTDEYGGDIEGRCTFMTEVIAAVGDVCGKDVPIIIRLCAEELLDDVGGNTPEESMVTYKMAERAGVDCISVTQGWQESSLPVISRDIPQGTWLYNAKRAKEAVSVPISMAYRLFKPDLPNKAIKDGALDIWEMCRPMIADPLMPKKVLEGREEDIRPCVACNLCLARLFRDAPMTCFVNPVCAHEWDPKWQITPAEMDKSIMIVGGGPAGLECAWVAARRGHEVHVYDSRDFLGGQIHYASKAPYGDEELHGVIDFLKTQCEKADVHFHLGTTVTPELIDEEMPDAVVIATGAKFQPGEVPGHDGSNVVSALDVLEDRVEPGTNVVIWGGRKPGIATALHLSGKDKNITMVSKERKVGKDVNPSYIWRYIQKLNQKGVKVYKNADILEINDEGVTVESLHGTKIPVKADTVVYAERKPVIELKDKAKELDLETHVIGDALVPRGLSHALHDGYRTGLRI